MTSHHADARMSGSRGSITICAGESGAGFGRWFADPGLAPPRVLVCC